MKAEHMRGERFIRIVDLPESFTNDLGYRIAMPHDFVIEVKYRGDGAATKGVILDNVIIPELVKRFNAEEAKQNRYKILCSCEKNLCEPGFLLCPECVQKDEEEEEYYSY